MRRKRLLWHIYPFFFVVSLVSILGVAWYSLRVFGAFHEREAARALLAQARLVEARFAARLEAEPAGEAIRRECVDLSLRAGSRITLILPSGLVVADSEEDPANMDNHGGRPEVLMAINQGEGHAVRYSATVQRNMLYVAVPARIDGRFVGIVRVALPLRSVRQALRDVESQGVLGLLLLVGLAGIGSFAVSRWLSRPIEEMKDAAERFARGDLSAKVPVPEPEELAELAGVLNRLAEQLGEKLAQVEQQRNDQAAVLASMAEGVVAVDQDERIINLNHAAGVLFGVRLEDARGRSLPEVIRNPDFHAVVRAALAGGLQPVEGDIVVYNGKERHLQAHGTVLRDPDLRSIGALIVLNDVTRLRRLESVRRDFVANVSHELKTPITSIKGFVETLQEGAWSNEQDARKFLAIMAKQADRLTSIIEDLLNLSRIEQDAESGKLVREPARVRDVLSAAAQLCQIKSAEKNIGIEIRCDAALTASINAPLMEQAIVNLLDNAVKYSPAQGRIEVAAAVEHEAVCLSVRDYGCGIEAQHLPRLFERFYRVDKARSRQMGGTGLGLAIVKHIAQAHGGTVSVESAPGKGAVFTIRIPLQAG